MTRPELIQIVAKASTLFERLGEQFDWSSLVRHYHQAHDMAMERVGAPRVGHLQVRVI